MIEIILGGWLLAVFLDTDSINATFSGPDLNVLAALKLNWVKPNVGYASSSQSTFLGGFSPRGCPCLYHTC